MYQADRFSGIPSGDVERLSPVLMPLLRKFEQSTALVTAEEVIAQAKRKACQLWVYHDGEMLRCVVATSVNEGLNRKGCLVWICVGHEFLELAEGVLSEIEEWAKSIGCTAMEIVGRAGWSKVIRGYRKAGVVFEKSLMGAN